MYMIKKTLASTIALLFICVGLQAQNMYDAIRFSNNEYYGTARSISIGNAVTAVGGDLGTIGINPAGSAIATYGQFTVTPMFSEVQTHSDYIGYSNVTKTAHTNRSFGIPNLGASIVMETGNSEGLKSITFAVVSNQTNIYDHFNMAQGVNHHTSKAAELAYSAFGIGEDILSNYKSYESSSVSWDILTAYQGGAMNPYGPNKNNYVAVTEALEKDGKWHYVPGQLGQTSTTDKKGKKNDIIFNLGFNISDKVFFGFNLGLPRGHYNYSESFHEAASQPSLFPISYPISTGGVYTTAFKNVHFDYKYGAEFKGVYGKIGVIVYPTSFLRLGAAIQTPTAYTISESWRYSVQTRYLDDSANTSASSPTGNYSYCLRSPYSASIGAALILGSAGFISVDYETTDYSIMRFSELDSRNKLDQNAFYDLNETNRLFAGISKSFRIGAELRLTPALSFRVGYNQTTSPERYGYDNKGMIVTADDYMTDFEDHLSMAKSVNNFTYYGDKTKIYSLGLGYSSKGSFFADFAVMRVDSPTSVFAPYYDYDPCGPDGRVLQIESPRVNSSIRRVSSVLTIGWRF